MQEERGKNRSYKGTGECYLCMGQRSKIETKQYEGKKIHIRYFGDLDPSGEAIEGSLIEKLTVEPYTLEESILKVLE